MGSVPARPPREACGPGRPTKLLLGKSNYLYVNVNLVYACTMSQKNRTWTISDLAREFDVSTRTIRFYEEKGFIHPRRDGQRRIYSASDRTRIRLILRGKRIGMSLAECMEIIDMYTPGDSSDAQLTSLLARVRERRSALEQQRRDLEETLHALDEIENLCRQAQRTRTQRPEAPRVNASEEIHP